MANEVLFMKRREFKYVLDEKQTKYFEEASSINFSRSCKYGFGVLGTAIAYRLEKWGIGKREIFKTH